MTRRLQRLVRARDRERALAAAHHASAQRRVLELEADIDRATADVERLASADAAPAETIAATCATVQQLQGERDVAEGHVSQRRARLEQASYALARAESTRDRALEQQRQESRRSEQKQQDELAQRGSS